MSSTRRDPPIPRSYTQSDTENVKEFRAIMVDATGDTKITNSDGEDVVLPSLVAGIWHPCRAVRVWSTGTTATTVVVGY